MIDDLDIDWSSEVCDLKWNWKLVQILQLLMRGKKLWSVMYVVYVKKMENMGKMISGELGRKIYSFIDRNRWIKATFYCNSYPRNNTIRLVYKHCSRFIHCCFNFKQSIYKSHFFLFWLDFLIFDFAPFYMNMYILYSTRNRYKLFWIDLLKFFSFVTFPLFISFIGPCTRLFHLSYLFFTSFLSQL